MTEQIYISFAGRDIKEQKFALLTSRSVETVTARFEFDDTWNEFSIKKAVFANGSTVKGTLLDAENSCVVPWEVLAESGDLIIGVVGQSGEKIMPSVQALARIIDGIYTDGAEPSAPSPDVYDQLLQAVEETKAIAQSVRDDADAGKFNGESADAATDEEVEEMLDEVFGETADTDIPEDSFATDEEVDEMLNEVFESASGESGGESSAGGTTENEDFATDEEVDEMLNEVFGTI